MKTLKLEDLVLDEKAWEVTRAGKEINLSFIEFILLREFLMHIGVVLTRRDLIVAIKAGTEEFAVGKRRKRKDKKYAEDSNVVDVYISYLRRKIDDKHKIKLIHTVRERGYKVKCHN